MRRLKVGLLGSGVVGRGVIRLVEQNRSLIRQRTGTDISISRVLVRNLDRERVGVNPALLTTRVGDVVDSDVDVVVELIGGTAVAREWIRESLLNRKHVVTANKALLAESGEDLLALAAVHGVELRFEASVCGAVPVIRVLRQALAADRVTSIRGVVNGTSNYILTRMGESGASFEDALGEAQCRGFAEADASLDVNGIDAAQKVTILAALAYGAAPLQWSRWEGIANITPGRIRAAARSGNVIRLVASACSGPGGILMSVAPEAIGKSDPLFGVRGEQNGVVLRTEHAGQLFLSGPGAGSMPSATAVVADLIELAGTWDVGWRSRQREPAVASRLFAPAMAV